MYTLIRRIVMLGAVAAAAVLGANTAEAQVATADAQAFIGDWDVSIPDVGTTFRVNVTDNNGQVAVAITGSEGGNYTGQSVRKEGQSLKFNYTTSIQGLDIPAEVTLTPADGGALSGTIDLAGQASLALRATKRQ
jgi:hypothetical protein